MEVSLNISYASSNQSSPLIGLTLHQLLEKRVDEHPDREMYVFPEDSERITFKAFKDRVENLAAGLLSIGIKKGDRQAVWGNIHMETLLFIAAARSIGVITEDNFETVFNELATKEGVNLNQIMLSRGEQIIKINDTPACLKLQLAHILDCVIVDSLNNSSIIETVDEDATVRVKVQGTGKNLSTVISILKTSTFHALRKKYSDFVGVSESKVKFSFDGEPVNMDSKPADLEIEDDDIIDAIVT